MPIAVSPVPPARAASLLLVRDGEAGLEVLMLERSARLDFAGGMLVFPGGRVDLGDVAPTLKARALPAGRHSGGEFACRMAVVRELFEETGILLAGQGPRCRTIGEPRRARLERRYRRALHRGVVRFASVAARADLRFRLDRLIPFAHWVTPAEAPKRFDARFYLAEAPRAQRASSDGIEALDHAWRRPADTLAAWEKGTASLMFPTRLNLMKLARASRVADALQQTRAAPIVSVQPKIARDGRRRLVIPEEAGFGLTEAAPEDLDPLERKALDDHLEALASHPWRR